MTLTGRVAHSFDMPRDASHPRPLAPGDPAFSARDVMRASCPRPRNH